MNIIKQQIIHLNEFLPLEKAIKGNNSKKSDLAWLYDRYKNYTIDTQGMNHQQLCKAFEEFAENLPDDSKPLNLEKFRIVPVETFDSNEQIDFLIKEGKFYYA